MYFTIVIFIYVYWSYIYVKLKVFTIISCQNKSKQQKCEILVLQKMLDLLNKYAIPTRYNELRKLRSDLINREKKAKRGFCLQLGPAKPSETLAVQ